MPGHRSPPVLSYAGAGVDRSEIGEALAALLGRVRYRPPRSHGRAVGPAGHFAGLVRIGRETIAVTTDTVGTKVLLARELGRWEEVGEDIVAINVNDLAAVGARPVGVVDIISSSRPDRRTFRAIGIGLDRGLRAGRCALLGGETAIVPDIVDGVDLGGTAVGYFPARAPVLGASIRPGDRLIGIPSTGFHSNGYTLIRRLVAQARIDLRRSRPGGRGPVGRELLRATRSYVPVSESLADRPEVTGLAHLSGGGVRNLIRLRPRVRFILDEWPEPPTLFPWLQSLGPLSDREMFQTFNMGFGFVVVVRDRATDDVLARLRSAGVPDARPVGRVTPGEGVEIPGWGVNYTGYA